MSEIKSRTDVVVGDKIVVTMIDGEVLETPHYATVTDIYAGQFDFSPSSIHGETIFLDEELASRYDEWDYASEDSVKHHEEETLQHRQSHAYYDDEALSPTYSDAVKAGMTFAEYTGVNITEESLDFEPKEEEVLRGITAESLNFEEAPKPDAVNHPSHYGKGRFETIEMIEEITKGYDNGFVAHCVGTAVKYESRAPFKHDTPLEDLRKARKYLEFAIEHLERMEAK